MSAWQLTGVRKDAWAKFHPLVVEQLKPQPDRDHYQRPEVHGRDWRHGIARLRAPRALDMFSHTATLSTAPTPDTPDRTG